MTDSQQFKHWLTVAFAGAALAVTPCGAADFREFSWGQSKEEIRQEEDLRVHHDREDEIAFWNFKLGGINSGLIYKFEDGRLASAHYLVRERTSDPREEDDIYAAFRQHFESELGEPVSEEWIGSNGAPSAETDRTLDVVRSGRGTHTIHWEYGRTSVRLELVGAGREFESLRVYFEPMDVPGLE